MPDDEMLLLDLAEKVQQLLRTAHRKRRHHDIAAPIEGPLRDVHEILQMVDRRIMEARPVGRLHQHIIRLLDVLRIPNQRLIEVSDITGEHELLRNALFRQPHFDGCRAEQMTRIDKTYPDTIPELDHLMIVHPAEVLQHIRRIREIIDRLHLRQTRTTPLPVLPLTLLHLDMRRIPQHDLGQRLRRLRRQHRPVEALLIGHRDHPRMIDMRMRQKDIVDLRILDRQRRILIVISPLLHTTVHQNPEPRRLYIV